MSSDKNSSINLKAQSVSKQKLKMPSA